MQYLYHQDDNFSQTMGETFLAANIPFKEISHPVFESILNSIFQIKTILRRYWSKCYDKVMPENTACRSLLISSIYSSTEL